MNETQKNLLKAFAGESMARNKYTFYAKKARAENNEWIARIFEETADNERAHAEELYEHMSGHVEMTNTYDIDSEASTLENLKHAAAGEKFEWGKMYPEFKKVALMEGEKKIAKLFQEISEVEEKHEERYLNLAEKIKSGTLHKSSKSVEWKCLNCGYVHKGKEAPKSCPVCVKPHGWYMELNAVR